MPVSRDSTNGTNLNVVIKPNKLKMLLMNSKRILSAAQVLL